MSTALEDEDYVFGIIHIYNDETCEIIENYNNGTFYESSYVIARVYKIKYFH